MRSKGGVRAACAARLGEPYSFSCSESRCERQLQISPDGAEPCLSAQPY